MSVKIDEYRAYAHYAEKYNLKISVGIKPVSHFVDSDGKTIKIDYQQVANEYLNDLKMEKQKGKQNGN